MNELNKPLTLQEAADRVGTSRSRLWRAMSDGHLSVEKRRTAGRSVWTVLEADLSKWAEEFLDVSALVPDVNTADLREQSPEHPRVSANDHEQLRTNANEHSEQIPEHPRTFVNDREQLRTNANEHSSPSHPPVELYLVLVDRLQRAERRTVELELTLQQSQRLLCENAESITEREARAKQAESVVDQHKQREQELASDNARLSGELEAARRQLEESQKPTGFFSWLGLRKKRATPVTVEKAV